MANAQIISGGSRAGHFLWNTLDEVKTGALCGVGGESLRGRVASVQVVREEQGKSFLKATATGLAGAALAGPVGALAGVAAGGNKSQILFIVTTHQGAQFLAKGDSKIYELLVAESFKPKAQPPKTMSAQIVSGTLLGQIRGKNGVFKVYGGPGQPPIQISGKIADLSVLERNGNEVRFECRLDSGSHFIAEGEASVYEAINKGYMPKEGRMLMGCFYVFILVGLALTLYYLANSY